VKPGSELGTAGSPRVGLAVPAAGSGRRMGDRKKPLLELRGTPVLLWALRPFLALDEVVSVAVAMAEDEVDEPPEWLVQEDPRIQVVLGGETRRDSVWLAISALPDDLDVIAVHDAARPLVSTETIRRCVSEAASGVGAVAGVPATDTLKRVDSDDRIVETPDRSSMWQAHTPQVFPANDLIEAYRRAIEEDWPGTDDAALVERMGRPVRMVESSTQNLKLTRMDDMALAELLLADES